MSRVLDRKKRRVPCQLSVQGRRHSGFVLDFSPSGLFIQTSATTRPGECLEIELALPADDDPVVVQVEVARKKVVPAQLIALAKGGLGVRVTSAPEAYYRFLREMGIVAGATADAEAPNPSEPVESEPVAAEAADDAAASPARFRVRVKQIGGSRSRIVDVDATDAEAAEVAALDRVGEGWKVLTAERC